MKTGLVVAGILSSCEPHPSELLPVIAANYFIIVTGTWSLTLSQHPILQYGISGGYWYVAGGTLQIAIFSVLASKVKMNINRATTFPEVSLMLSLPVEPSDIKYIQYTGCICSVRQGRTPCFPLVRPCLQFDRFLLYIARRRNCRDCSDRNECICCLISHPNKCFCIRCDGVSVYSYMPMTQLADIY